MLRRRHIRGTADRRVRWLLDSPIVWLNTGRAPRLAYCRALVGWRAGVRPVARRWLPVARLRVRRPLIRGLRSRRALRLAYWRALVGRRARGRPAGRRWLPVAPLRVGRRPILGRWRRRW